MMTEFFEHSCSKSLFYCQVHFYVKKSIIKFVEFAVNSVISIIICFCPVLFIHLFTPIEGPITQQNIHGGTRGPDMSRAEF